MGKGNKSEVELLKLYNELEDIIDNNPMSIQIVDKEGFTLRVNPAHTLLFGAVPPPGFSIFSDLQNRQPELEEYISRAKNGETVHLPDMYYNVHDLFSELPDVPVWITAVIFPLKDNNGKPERFVFMHENITENKLAEEALHIEKENFRLSLDNSPLGVRIVSMDGDTIYANQTILNFYGYDSLGELQKTSLKKRYTPESYAEAQIRKHQRESGDLSTTNYEINIVRKNGEIRCLQVFRKNVLWDGVSQFQVLYNDITERKQAEEETKLINIELQRINAEKDKFYSIIAHDLRNPFNSLLGFTKLLTEELDTLSIKEIQNISVSMRSTATNLYQLLENLLHWARMDKGLIPFNPEVVQLLPIVDDSMVMVMESVRIKEIEMTISVPDYIKVFGDSNMLQTVLRNLVSNAVKFTFKGGKIHLSARATGDNSVEISISDTGIGMNNELVDNLFRLDVQTNREGTDGELSTGLGLIICKDFIEKLGGKLWVESEEGKGSKFKFTLPNAC